jgi:hypothetical protein
MLSAMNRALDRLWQRIHETAMSLALQKSLPSPRHAEAIILQILREEDVQLPDDYTVASLAEELRRATLFQPHGLPRAQGAD